MKSKDLVSSFADLMIVGGLIAAVFIFKLPGICAAFLAYGVFRHIYAAVATEHKVQGASPLNDQAVWNVLDLVIVGTTFWVGYQFVTQSLGWLYVAPAAYVGLRHVFYACYTPSSYTPVDSGIKDFTSLAGDFMIVAALIHGLIMMSCAPLLQAVPLGASWSLAGLFIYMVLRHLFAGICVCVKSDYETKGYDVPANLEKVGYLSEDLFYNFWDLLILVTAFAAGFIWQVAPPFVAAVLFVIVRLIFWACIKGSNPLKDRTPVA